MVIRNYFFLYPKKEKRKVGIIHLYGKEHLILSEDNTEGKKRMETALISICWSFQV
jgi:hypothetical protein